MFSFYVEGKTFAETKHSKLLASGISCGAVVMVAPSTHSKKVVGSNSPSCGDLSVWSVHGVSCV